MAYLGSTPTTQSFIAGTDSFNGTGSATNFTLSRLVNSTNDIQVVVNNVVQYPPNYSVSGNTLTISPAPSAGTNNVYVRYLSTTLQSVAPIQGSVGISQLSATGTPSASTFLRGDNSWSLVAGFDSGTLMLFQQTAAPTGWTKQTTHNNKALRVVSGSASSGGSVAFTTAFANGSTGATTLTTAQIPSHSHSLSANNADNTGQTPRPGANRNNASNFTPSTNAEGGGNSHTHSLTLDVQYVDLIIASKD